jgi:hypothetical protein
LPVAKAAVPMKKMVPNCLAGVHLGAIMLFMERDRQKFNRRSSNPAGVKYLKHKMKMETKA